MRPGAWAGLSQNEGRHKENGSAARARSIKPNMIALAGLSALVFHLRTRAPLSEQRGQRSAIIRKHLPVSKALPIFHLNWTVDLLPSSYRPRISTLTLFLSSELQSYSLPKGAVFLSGLCLSQTLSSSLLQARTSRHTTYAQ